MATVDFEQKLKDGDITPGTIHAILELRDNRVSIIHAEAMVECDPDDPSKRLRVLVACDGDWPSEAPLHVTVDERDPNTLKAKHLGVDFEERMKAGDVKPGTVHAVLQLRNGRRTLLYAKGSDRDLERIVPLVGAVDQGDMH